MLHYVYGVSVVCFVRDAGHVGGRTSYIKAISIGLAKRGDPDAPFSLVYLRNLARM